jgi:hypothetical protein
MAIRSSECASGALDAGNQRHAITATVINGDWRVIQPLHNLGEALGAVRGPVYQHHGRPQGIGMVADDVKADWVHEALG